MSDTFHCDICKNDFDTTIKAVTFSLMFYGSPMEYYRYLACRPCADTIKTSVFDTIKDIVPGV